VLVVVAAGCGSFGDGIGGSMTELEAAVERSGDTGTSFRLTSVTDFEWDRVHVFGPYTPPAQIDRALGFHWDDAENSEARETDGITLVAFVRDRKVIRAFDQARGPAFLDCLGRRVLKRNGLTPDDAVLRTERVTVAGEDRYDVVVPARPLTPRQERAARRCLGQFSA
jgi:hypothetical protein